MTSQRQKRANKADALRSTGPRTPKGRAATALNAVRHGLLCGDRILPGEDFAAFNDLRNGVQADIAPSGPIEQLLADRVISAIWRLRRLEDAECALFPWHSGADLYRSAKRASAGRLEGC